MRRFSPARFSPARFRWCALTVSLVTTLTGAAVFVSGASVSGAAILPPNNPPVSIHPSSRWQPSCLGPFALGQPVCDQVALADINDARAAEGVKALVLPSNYSSLTEAEQDFVITNLERIDRGLPPIVGLSRTLDAYALRGAQAYEDPTPPPSNPYFASNEYQGQNAAPSTDFGWMYDDGYPSTNIDCFVPTAPGCWGHRDNVLLNWSAYPKPVVMGVGVYEPHSDFVGDTSNSVGQLWVSGWTGPLYFTWAQESRYLIGTAKQSKAGYRMLGATGFVYAFGNASAAGSASLPGGTAAVHIETAGNRRGYWVVNDRGNVYSFGGAHYYGGSPALQAFERVASLSTTPSGHGYWLFTNLGRAIPYGDAHFYGDMRATHLNGPVISSVATPTGRGYYMVASDGGIFTFGDARFRGSLGDRHLNGPVVGIAPTPNNQGYWLVASDGGIFAFNAPFRGSMGGQHLNRPVIGMVSFGSGYLMVASDGGIFDFSDRPFVGSLGGNPPLVPVVGVAS